MLTARPGIPRLSRDEERASERGRSAKAKVGYVYGLRWAEGKLYTRR